MSRQKVLMKRLPSLSARRAWIEIVYPGTWSGSILVALRKESVDRNTLPKNPMISVNEVALRKESVDRNIDTSKDTIKATRSLSARRAWIEIGLMSVVRFATSSLSARRAWIEISAP